MTPKPLSRLLLGSLPTALAATLATTVMACEPSSDLPPEFEQLIPRGRIASVDAPEFVAASEAEISDDAWIFGVEIDGKARAYSLNLLNSHEIVNDKIGEHSFAAVW